MHFFLILLNRRQFSRIYMSMGIFNLNIKNAENIYEFYET